MARIFFALAALAVVLLVANLMFALVKGDFGAAVQRYVQARGSWETAYRSPQSSAQQLRDARETFTLATRTLNEQRKQFWPHIWLGIVATLLALLVNCISVTYFIGTSRWCREVVAAYGMDPSWAQRSQALKRRAFPWALAGIVTLLLILLLGGASDVYSPAIRNPADWIYWHMLSAMLGIVVIVISFLVQVTAVGANYRLINEIVAEANRIREASS